MDDRVLRRESNVWGVRRWGGDDDERRGGFWIRGWRRECGGHKKEVGRMDGYYEREEGSDLDRC